MSSIPVSSIPNYLFHEIFITLPVKILLVCKSVCKNWLELISSSNFINAHLNLTTHRHYFLLELNRSFSQYTAHSIGYESLNKRADDAVDKFDKVSSIDGSFSDLLCSCNGLVCINYRTNQGFIVLWNPATREYKELPQPPTSERLLDLSSALGYDYKINDYKFVIIVQLDERTIEILVYTLGSNCWKKIQNISCRRHLQRSGVLVNGAFHWLGVQPEDYSGFIICFDISNERTNVMQLPKEALDEGHGICVGVLEGCVCVVAIHYCDDEVRRRLIIWVMQEYGVRESWTKRYIINHEGILKHWYHLKLIRCFKNGEILFDFPLGCYDKVIYNPKNGSFREPNLQGFYNIIHEQGSYFETLVSLNSGMYVGKNGRVELSLNRQHYDEYRKYLLAKKEKMKKKKENQKTIKVKEKNR